MATDIRSMSREELDEMNRRGKEWRELQAAMANDQEADHADFIKRRTHALRQMDLFGKGGK